MAEKKIAADKKAEEAVKEVKAEVKSAAEKTGAAVKETAKKAVKTAEKAVKTAAKATKAKKATVKKAVEAEIKDEVFVQFAGVEINVRRRLTFRYHGSGDQFFKVRSDPCKRQIFFRPLQIRRCGNRCGDMPFFQIFQKLHGTGLAFDAIPVQCFFHHLFSFVTHHIIVKIFTVPVLELSGGKGASQTAHRKCLLICHGIPTGCQCLRPENTVIFFGIDQRTVHVK